MTRTPRTQASSEPTLRVRSLADLLGIIPSLLGFHPAESLVLVVVDDGHIAVTARGDLADAHDPEDAHRCFGALWDRFPGAECVALAYTQDASAAWAVLDGLDCWAPYGAIIDVVHIDGARWRCSEDDPGHSYDPTCSALAAEATYRGIRVLPDRAALALSLAPVVGDADMHRALSDVLAQPPASTLARARALLAEGVAPGAVIDADAGAVLAVAAHNPAFVEQALSCLTQESAAEAVRLWTCVARVTTSEVADAAVTMLGLASWLAGDGAMVNVCLERAVRLATESAWYVFLQAVAGSALPPSRWEDIRLRLFAA